MSRAFAIGGAHAGIYIYMRARLSLQNKTLYTLLHGYGLYEEKKVVYKTALEKCYKNL